MTSKRTSIVSHISIGTNDFERARAFYDAVLATIGVTRQLEYPGSVAYGVSAPEFWVKQPVDGAQATTGNGTHVAFAAPSREAVDAFYEAALAAGATSEGEPGPRPQYTPAYYACFIRDLDGHKIEAMINPKPEVSF